MSVKQPDPARADQSGRAYKGSQRQLQDYVNEHSTELNKAILDSIPSLAELSPKFVWVSPAREAGYAEYSDREFLEKLGLEEHWPALRKFWPQGGPVWDGLARLQWNSGKGILLVEAKSYPEECRSACRAGAESLVLIQKALRETQEGFGAAPSEAWLNEYYQLANRLAHLHFLRRQGVEAWLVHVLFTNDWKSTPRECWERELGIMWDRLGLPVKHPWIGHVFMEIPVTNAET